MTRAKATAIGMTAIGMWSLLALFTIGSAPVPPFLLNALTFAIGGAVGLVWIALTGGFRQLAGVHPKIYLFGAIGLFGYHFLYFTAFRLSPTAETGLIACLWPLVLVLVLGLGLAAAPVAFRMFSRAPAGGSMILDFRPFMTAETITAFQPQNVNAASASENSRTWQVRCTT